MENTKFSVGGIWLNESKAGVKYMKGKVSPYDKDEVSIEISQALTTLKGFDILIFKNTNKEEGSNAPDYRLYFDPPQDAAGALKNTFATKADDDVPF